MQDFLKKTGGKLRRIFFRKKEDNMFLPGDTLSPEKKDFFIGLSVMIAVFGILLSVLSFFIHRMTPPVTLLERPSFGTQSETELILEKDGAEEKIRITLHGKDPSSEEMKEVFQTAFSQAKETILNGNESFLKVRRRLRFFSEDEYGISYRYESDREEVLSNRGNILTDVSEEIPLTVRVTLSYKAFSEDFSLNVVLVPEDAERSFSEKVAEELKIRESDGVQEESFLLPTEIDGEKILFRVPERNAFSIAVVFLLFAITVFLYPLQKEKRAEKKRETDLETTYAAIVMQLNLLIQADMSIRSAWTEIVSEYEKEQDVKKRKANYAYEEMKLTLHDMENGTGEESAYIRFGMRCKIHSYVRLGNLLSQNLKQGVSGLRKSLDEECRRALREHTNTMLRRGEKAGSKLLFPMVLILGIVLLCFMVPAFLSF